MTPSSLEARPDFKIIAEIIQPGTKVLDLGCGEGLLLAWLATHKKILARGVEIETSNVRKAIARGVSAYQGDIDEGLADYPDKAFDYVILSQTLQETRAPLRAVDGDAAGGPESDHFVSELRALARPAGDAVQRAGSENGFVSVRLVQLAQYPLPLDQ